MTLEECIDYAEKQSECMSKYTKIDIYKDKSEYYRQLAEWLKELKAYRDTYKNYSKVEKMLICEVEKAKENPSVKKPISYGLYQTWKWADANEEEREINDE